MECWEVSGNVDYLARFVCADLARYETLTTDLIDESELGVARIVSHIALRPVRRFAGYPASVLTPPARVAKTQLSRHSRFCCTLTARAAESVVRRTEFSHLRRGKSLTLSGEVSS